MPRKRVDSLLFPLIVRKFQYISRLAIQHPADGFQGGHPDRLGPILPQDGKVAQTDA